MLFKSIKDTRYNPACVTTHDQLSYSARARVDHLADLDGGVDGYQVVGIDEGQFFDDIVEVASAWADAGVVVIVAALDGTFQRQPFGHVLELIPFADTVVKLPAVCMRCGHDAPFTCRTSAEKEVEVIGNGDKYQPLCRACFLKK